jgi:hypothetical protein
MVFPAFKKFYGTGKEGNIRLKAFTVSKKEFRGLVAFFKAIHLSKKQMTGAAKPKKYLSDLQLYVK